MCRPDMLSHHPNAPLFPSAPQCPWRQCSCTHEAACIVAFCSRFSTKVRGALGHSP